MPVAPTYPDWEVGDLVTADMLTAMQPAVLVKPGATSRTSTTTLTADPDLAGITLGVGTWRIELMVFFNCATTATQGFKTQWGFSGTWNNPIRGTFGPGTSNTAAPGAVDTVNLAGLAAGSSLAYLLAAGSTYAMVREITYTAVVTVAGDLSLLWSQNASSANATSVQAGSAFEVRQIG